MELATIGTQSARSAGTMKAGREAIAVVAGQSLKVETSPHGEEVLNAECPAGKAWSVQVDVTITETDA